MLAFVLLLFSKGVDPGPTTGVQHLCFLSSFFKVCFFNDHVDDLRIHQVEFCLVNLWVHYRKILPRRRWVSGGKLLPPHEMLWKHLAEDSAHHRETPSSPVRLIKMFTIFRTWGLISFKMHCLYPSNFFIIYIYILISGGHTPKPCNLHYIPTGFSLVLRSKGPTPRL